MKSLSINFWCMNLFIIVIVSFFTISCEKDIPTDPQVVTEAASADPVTNRYLMPKGFGEKSEAEQATIIEKLSIEEVEELKENLKVALYLKEIGKYEAIYQDLKEGQTFLEPELGDNLSKRELRELTIFTPSLTSLDQMFKGRICTTWWHYYTWMGSGSDCLNLACCACCEWKARWRSCWTILDGSYVEENRKYWNMCW